MVSLSATGPIIGLLLHINTYSQYTHLTGKSHCHWCFTEIYGIYTAFYRKSGWSGRIAHSDWQKAWI